MNLSWYQNQRKTLQDKKHGICRCKIPQQNSSRLVQPSIIIFFFVQPSIKRIIYYNYMEFISWFARKVQHWKISLYNLPKIHRSVPQRINFTVCQFLEITQNIREIQDGMHRVVNEPVCKQMASLHSTWWGREELRQCFDRFSRKKEKKELHINSCAGW